MIANHHVRVVTERIVRVIQAAPGLASGRVKDVGYSLHAVTHNGYLGVAAVCAMTVGLQIIAPNNGD